MWLKNMFAVYVNHPRNIAMIHRTSYHHFENRIADTENGFWQSNFNSYEEARTFAENTHKRIVRRCLKCF